MAPRTVVPDLVRRQSSLVVPPISIAVLILTSSFLT
jgi:hypothetical protein